MRILPYALPAMLLGLSSLATLAADQVVIVTSFPKELTDAYKKAYEARAPGTTVEILNKGTAAGIAYIRETAAGARPDVFWVSAPDAFEVLARENLLVKLPKLNAAVPEKIGDFPINDPEGFYQGQALAGYGIMFNERYLKGNDLPPPRDWADLAQPAWFGHVATSAPSRSGTTHLTMETILQGEGWTKGWTLLARIAGNCAAIPERSTAVPDGVGSGQYGAGLVIDFFGYSARNSGLPVDFVYPAVTAIVPANIGLIAGAKNADAAQKFMAWTVSDEGQALLLQPKISRLPVLPAAYAKAPAGFPRPYEKPITAKVKFDPQLSESRYYVVSALFDQTITFRHPELTAAAKAIHAAAEKVAKSKNAAAQKLLEEARTLAFTPLVSEAQIKDPEFLKTFRASKKDAEAGKKMTAAEEAWGNQAKANYAKARELATKAASM
ncbi:MAG: extracellular solute-binding protein [Verrucomicrobia bacterium]|nr:extracellular solute-binding protein [Verrucomicrobiota bacterium]